MRLSPVSFTFSASTLALLVACVGGPGTLPGEEGTVTESPSSGDPEQSGEPLPDRPPPTPRDAGAPAEEEEGPEATCTGNPQTEVIGSETCQACLDASCCTELKACFTKQASTGKLDCDAFAACLTACDAEADPATCFADCDASAGAGVAQAFEAILNCGVDSCANDCQ